MLNWCSGGQERGGDGSQRAKKAHFDGSPMCKQCELSQLMKPGLTKIVLYVSLAP